MKILVVDDKIMQLKGIKIGLRTEGHVIVTALSAEEALIFIKIDPLTFDLIITDYLMANMNGLDLLKAVRKKGLFVPVLLMTAYGKKDLLIEAMQNQCSGCIEKPFTFEQLLGEIARIQKNAQRNSNSQQVGIESLAHIVHQINNPLSAIVGNVAMALHYVNDPEDVKHSLNAIIRATDNIQEINKKILNTVRSDRGNELKNKSGRVDLKELLHDCLNMFEGLIGQKGISLETILADGKLEVLGDRFSLRQIFNNLIMNAIQAMDESARKSLAVTVEDDRPAEWIAVHIADSGCGVPQASINDFFNSTKPTKKNGSGIGLQVVKEMVEQHKGQLLIRSQEGQGAVISVKLPALNASIEVARTG